MTLQSWGIFPNILQIIDSSSLQTSRQFNFSISVFIFLVLARYYIEFRNFCTKLCLKGLCHISFKSFFQITRGPYLNGVLKPYFLCNWLHWLYLSFYSCSIILWCPMVKKIARLTIVTKGKNFLTRIWKSHRVSIR